MLGPPWLQDPIVASLFDFVSDFWPVMVRKNSNPPELQDQAAEGEGVKSKLRMSRVG